MYRKRKRKWGVSYAVLCRENAEIKDSASMQGEGDSSVLQKLWSSEETTVIVFLKCSFLALVTLLVIPRPQMLDGLQNLHVHFPHTEILYLPASL